MRRLSYILVVMTILSVVAIGCKKKEAAAPAEETAAPAAETAKAEAKEAVKQEAKAEGDEAAKEGDEAAKEGDEAAKEGDEAAKEGDEAAANADSIGVPECDEYLTKYEACVKDKVPEAARETMTKGIQQMRDAWKQAAQTDAGKQGLAQACKTALEAAEKATAAYKCEW